MPPEKSRWYYTIDMNASLGVLWYVMFKTPIVYVKTCEGL